VGEQHDSAGDQTGAGQPDDVALPGRQSGCAEASAPTWTAWRRKNASYSLPDSGRRASERAASDDPDVAGPKRRPPCSTPSIWPRRWTRIENNIGADWPAVNAAG